MGKLNLITGSWDNKVGQLVGAKWRTYHTVRAYAVPSNPNTEAQQTIRTVFKDMTTFVARFADGIKYLNALDTSSMSVRNAIIKLNKDQFDSENGTFDKTTLLISKGGLQPLQNFATTFTSAAGGNVTCTWTAPTASNITSEAKAIIVVVDETNDNYEIIEALASAATATGTTSFTAGGEISIYGYILDEHGSYTLASKSTYLATA